jgi:hypothetical protein
MSTAQWYVKHIFISGYDSDNSTLSKKCGFPFINHCRLLTQEIPGASRCFNHMELHCCKVQTALFGYITPTDEFQSSFEITAAGAPQATPTYWERVDWCLWTSTQTFVQRQQSVATRIFTWCQPVAEKVALWASQAQWGHILLSCAQCRAIALLRSQRRVFCVRGLQFAYRVELHAPAEENNPTNIGLLKGKGNEAKGKGWHLH